MVQFQFMAKNLPHTAPNAGSQAREQAKAYDSLLADTELALDDGTIMNIPPHPDLGMLDDDRMEAYEELLMEVETYDREDDIFIPEQRLKDPQTGKENGVVIPASTQQGMLKRPFRKTDEDGVTHRVTPAHSIRVVQAVLGDTAYKQLRAGGRSAKDVWRLWSEQGLELRQRQAGDPKSNGSPVDLAAVSTTDSE